MCARYSLHQSNALIADLFDLQWTPELQPRYNVAPTNSVPAVIRVEGKNVLDFFRWGLVPTWADDPKIGARMINARSETAAEKPSFRGPFKNRRCLIPADGFFEWHEEEGKKQPYLVSMKDDHLFAFAGLWEQWFPDKTSDENVLKTCTILTCGSNALLSPIHDRMPVILPKEKFDTWLDPDLKQREPLESLMTPYNAEEMRMFPVTRLMSNPRYNEPDAVKPLQHTV